jgi:hypothetical protein
MKHNISTQPDEFPELVQHKSSNARIYHQRHREGFEYFNLPFDAPPPPMPDNR